MSQDWYYMSGADRCGPVPTAELKELAASGELQPTDKVWREGMAKWAAAGTMKGLFSDAVATAPAPRAAARPRDSDEESDPPRRSRQGTPGFTFDGGAGSYFKTGLLANLLVMVTLGFGFPWALCMYQRWSVEHTLIEGRRLRFFGTGGELFGLWIKWFLLTAVTLGIYSFWIVPAVNRWIVEHTEFGRD